MLPLSNLIDYLPQQINSGRWLSWYTLERLRNLDSSVEIVLPICSLGTPYGRIAELGELVLPPVFHEAVDATLKQQIVAQIERCIPYHELLPDLRSAGPRMRVVELPADEPTDALRPDVLAYSVDTAVEEHGPHLPLATDTIQSYSVLRRLADECDTLTMGPPVDYGQLTWGLPFGFSIDLTVPLLTDYVCRFVNALLDWQQPTAIYVVDVHGSIAHREAIVAGIRKSRAQQWAFRWLHEPLVEFASQRGDQHAGGVETALVEHVSRDLIDPNWWPRRIGDIAGGQMSFEQAVELTANLQDFVAHARAHNLNGIVGDVRNYERLDAELLFERMLSVARRDVEALLHGQSQQGQQEAGRSAW